MLALIWGICEEEVFIVTAVKADADGRGGATVMCNSNSLPGCTVFSSARNASLVHCTSERTIGSERLLRMRRTLVSFVGASVETVNTAVGGMISIGFHTVPKS